MPNRPLKPPSKSYEVGYGRPPKKFRFKRGQSGNPSGTKTASKAPNLNAVLQRALGKKVTQGKQGQMLTRGAAGIERLVSQFADGDRHARRDLMALAEKLGVDLTAGHSKAIESALEENLAAEDEALLADFVQRCGGHYDPAGDSDAVAPRKGSNIVLLPRKERKKFPRQHNNGEMRHE